jgi:hypothetical protein
MLLGHESFAYSKGKDRKALRTSFPLPGQRSAYYLQLPWRYSIPLMISMALLHYAISQSLFLEITDVYDINREMWPAWSTLPPQYSHNGVLVLILWGAVMVATLYGLGLRRYEGHMPLMSSNSLATAAACHPPRDDINAATSEIAYGVLPGDGDRVSFTSFEVGQLLEGVVYH